MSGFRGADIDADFDEGDHGGAEPMGLPPLDVIERMAKDCRCCIECANPPCDGVMAGGVCDRRCTCDEDDGPDLTEMDYDPDEDRTP